MPVRVIIADLMKVCFKYEPEGIVAEYNYDEGLLLIFIIIRALFFEPVTLECMI